MNGKITENNPLPSFNEGETKTSILDFVRRVTDRESKDYVKPGDRIAAFDNDGTLWVEHPLPTQVYFILDRLKSLSTKETKLKDEMPYKAVLSGDMEAIKKFTFDDIVKIAGETQEFKDENEFYQTVQNWLDTWIHPVLKTSYHKLVYQPMLELFEFLRKNEFEVYIVSAGSIEFMRPWVEKIYGVPVENVIGTAFKRKAIKEGDSIHVVQTTDFEINDDHLGKVISIDRIIGKKPIFVGGNSDGDLEMMQYATTDHNAFCSFLYHNDGDREFDYSSHTIQGKLDAGMTEAKKRGWTIINMKNDWNQIFPE